MDEKDLLIAQLRKENAALRQMIEDLQKQVKNLTEAVLLLRKNRFGSKSERTRNLLEEDGQLNLFNEIELEGDPKKKVLAAEILATKTAAIRTNFAAESANQILAK